MQHVVISLVDKLRVESFLNCKIYQRKDVDCGLC